MTPAVPAPAAPTFAGRLVAWQAEHGRHALPWQRTRDPYRVWLSEIMLQQTQVATVLGYYARFLARFPDVRALADAPLDDVLALWSGLGYYRRARYLHHCAQAVVADHGGVFPRSSVELARLPGIGRTTAAAIAAFCFDERVAILDGNVKRVLARLLAFEGDLSDTRQERTLLAHAEALLPIESAAMPAYTQGLMDLGATVCTPRAPACLLCPVAGLCAGRASGAPERFPVKTRTLKRSFRESWWLWLEVDGRVFLRQRPDTGVWAGLWTLPLYDDAEALAVAAAAVGAAPETLPDVAHALTHFDWLLHPRRAVLAAGPPAAALAFLGDGRWVAYDMLDTVALPAPLRKLLLARPG